VLSSQSLLPLNFGAKKSLVLKRGGKLTFSLGATSLGILELGKPF